MTFTVFKTRRGRPTKEEAMRRAEQKREVIAEAVAADPIQALNDYENVYAVIEEDGIRFDFSEARLRKCPRGRPRKNQEAGL